MVTEQLGDLKPGLPADLVPPDSQLE